MVDDGIGAAQVRVFGSPDSRFPLLVRSVHVSADVQVVPVSRCGSGDLFSGADLCIFDCSLAAVGPAIRLLLAERTPFLVSCAAGIDGDALQRLARAAAKRRVASSMIGTLRLAPAVCRARELTAAGVLGDIEHIQLCRPVASDGADSDAEKIERFRDIDALHWLCGDSGCGAEVALSTVVGGVAMSTVGARAESCCRAGSGERHLTMRGTLGSIEAVFGVGLGGGRSRGAFFRFVSPRGSRDVRIPSGSAACAELAVSLFTVPVRGVWPCLPALTECAGTWGRACFF